MVRVSIIVGCFGNAPISSKRCTMAAAFAPLPADVAGAGEATDGAAEVAEVVWLWGADGTGVSSVSVVIVCTGVTGTVAVTLGVTGAVVADTGEAGLTGLMGLTGESTLVGFVIDLTQVLDDVTHEPQTGCPYGSGQILVEVWVIAPVYPA